MRFFPVLRALETTIINLALPFRACAPGEKCNEYIMEPTTYVLPVAELTNLVELDLSSNFLESVPVQALKSLTNLKFLNLGSNKIRVSCKIT